jgi:hypothetical protein
MGEIRRDAVERGCPLLVLAAAALLAACASGTGRTAAPSSGSSTSRPAPTGRAGGAESNARSGPASGGAAGTVDSVFPSRFTLMTSAGVKVAVDEAAVTTYVNGTSSTAASAITPGQYVLVVGTASGVTIAAARVTVQPTGGSGSTSSAAAGVVPFRAGAPAVSKQVGEIPANYSPGSGTIASGPNANAATEAALTAYPGGVIDRVVQLTHGEYEVHNIGVSWPHHIFVDQAFKVVGAD